MTDSEPTSIYDYFAFAMDGAMRIKRWSRWAERLLGYREIEVRGRPCYEVLQFCRLSGAGICAPDYEPMQHYRVETVYTEPHCTAKHKDGRTVPVRFAGIPTQCPVESEAFGVEVFLWPVAPTGIPSRGFVHDRVIVHSLGRFHVHFQGRRLATDRWVRKQAVTVLKVLLTYRGRPVHREYLMELLWPGQPPEPSWNRLKSIISLVRQEFRSVGVPDHVLQRNGENYHIDERILWMDADVFEHRVHQAISLERNGEPDLALESYEAAAFLYVGEYLEEDPFAEVFVEERERLRAMYDRLQIRVQQLRDELIRPHI